MQTVQAQPPSRLQCRAAAVAPPVLRRNNWQRPRGAGRTTAAATVRAVANAAAANGANANANADADPFFFASDFGDMQQAMRQFDRDMDSYFWGGRSPFFEAERQMDRALRRADEAAAAAREQASSGERTTTTTTTRNDNNVRVERSESRAPGSYRYYERIEISSGQPLTFVSSSAAGAAAPPPLLLLFALVAAGAYAAVTAAFSKNYHLTLYAARDRLRLALTWPLLLLTSPSFRAQFVTAVVKGERVRVTSGLGGGGDASSSASSASAAAAPLPPPSSTTSPASDG
jgi:hypothetical protein